MIEAVTVCVGFVDYLAETMPCNGHFFRRWTIVTAPNDEATIEFCHENSLNCMITEEFYRDGAFNKGRGIQRGLDSISCADWVLNLDADIALPREFPQALEMANLDPDCIYGCDRILIRGHERWDEVRNHQDRQHGGHCYVKIYERDPIGVRWASPNHGYVPIGFFQLWNPRSSARLGRHQKSYPAHHSNAARSDVQFALQWDRRKRVLLPELLVWHIEAEKQEVGANWKGRRTRPFRSRSAPASKQVILDDGPAVAMPG